MHLSQNSFCCLCASSQEDTSLTGISSVKGQRENLVSLFDQYIIPILLLSKEDKLCVCDTCKTRLFEWNSFITSCKIAQKRLKDSLSACKQSELTTCSKRQGDSANDEAVSLATDDSPPKKRKSSNYCIAPWCNKGNYQGVSLFRLPKERDRALIWLTESGRSDLKSMKSVRSLYLCANHFTTDMFTNNAHNQLVKTAVPKIFPKAPYANKIARKTATSQIFPTQFKGVQLKSILPKVTLSNSVSPATYKKVVMKAVSRPKTVTILNTIVPRISSQTSQEALSVSEDQTSSLLFVGQSQSSTSSAINIVNADPSLPHVNMDTVPQNSNFDIYSSSSTFVRDPYDSNTLNCAVKPPNSSSSGSSVLESSSSAERTALVTKLRPSNCGTKEQKQYLDELESCFATDGFNSNTLMTVQELKPPEICQLQTLSQTDSYKSIAGSQDFLLTHVSDNITKSSSFDEQSYPLRSDSSVHSSDDHSHSVSGESNPILNHNNELNSPHIGIFDIPSDIQGTESSFINNIENLDELMDLDKYFEVR